MNDLHRLQSFGQFAQSDAQRSLKLLRAIEGTLDNLSRLKTKFHALETLANDMTEEFVSIIGPINPSGSLVSTYETIRDSYGEAHALMRAKRDMDARVPSLRSDDGILEAYDAVLESLAGVHNALNNFCWAIAEHDADFEKPTGKRYTDIEEMFSDMGV